MTNATIINNIDLSIKKNLIPYDDFIYIHKTENVIVAVLKCIGSSVEIESIN
jgi:hypothetical protein